MSWNLTRVIIVDDHTVVREGIRSVLDDDPGVRVVADAADGATALALAEKLEPDVMILDMTMPGMSGVEVADEIRKRKPGIAVLILSMHDQPEYVLGAVKAGARGYLLKDCGPKELREAVHAVARGEDRFSPEMTRQLSAAVRNEASRDQERERLDVLTDREREVLLRVAEGLTSREIGEALGISHRTVETHRESIMRKLDIRSVAGLTRFVLELGLLDDKR